MAKSTLGACSSRAFAVAALAALAGCGNSAEPTDQAGGMSGVGGGFVPGASGSGAGSGVGGGVAGNPPLMPFPPGVGGGGGVMSGGAGTSAGAGGVPVAGSGGTTPLAGAGGMLGGSGGTETAGMGGAGVAGSAPPSGAGCTPAPSGSFETMTVTGTGPDGNYTIFRPATLGEGGFKHPPVAWGNGLATTPDLYAAWLSNVASNGFVVIANPGTGSDPMVVRQGLEWLIAQGESGEYAGKLAVDCAGTLGYSMGGGAAVGAGSHPAVRAIVSVHGLQDASDKASGPILLTTSDDDSFVTPEGFVQPCYDRSSVQPTMMAMYISGNAPSFNGHLTPIGDGMQDAEPSIAWLRFWLYGDEAQRHWFFGDDCTLCVSPWGMAQRKNYDWN